MVWQTISFISFNRNILYSLPHLPHRKCHRKLYELAWRNTKDPLCSAACLRSTPERELVNWNYVEHYSPTSRLTLSEHESNNLRLRATFRIVEAYICKRRCQDTSKFEICGCDLTSETRSMVALNGCEEIIVLLDLYQTSNFLSKLTDHQDDLDNLRYSKLHYLWLPHWNILSTWSTGMWLDSA